MRLFAICHRWWLSSEFRFWCPYHHFQNHHQIYSLLSIQYIYSIFTLIYMYICLSPIWWCWYSIILCSLQAMQWIFFCQNGPIRNLFDSIDQLFKNQNIFWRITGLSGLGFPKNSRDLGVIDHSSQHQSTRDTPNHVPMPLTLYYYYLLLLTVSSSRF